jgi:hypothetical protein
MHIAVSKFTDMPGIGAISAA